MNIKLLEETTINPLNLIGKRMGICWSSDITDSDKNVKRAKDNFIHGRCQEFVNIEFVVSEISARCLREISRHVIGVTYLQESTRYVNYNTFKYYDPSVSFKNEKDKQLYYYAMNTSQNIYRSFANNGVAIEDIANILPLGMNTKAVFKCNLRGLINFMNMRLCSRAYKEIREFAGLLKSKLSDISPEWKYIADNYFVPKCEAVGYCVEKHCCGRKPKGIEGLKDLLRKEIKNEINGAS